MLAGEVSLRDLPDAFDAKMREYLGLQPPDVVVGVLQDVHWSDMSMGYFPTYALGNVVSVQLWERATADLGDLDEQFERGEFAPLREWLRENVHRHGRAFTPQELLQRAAGSSMDPAPYLRYLERKLSDLLGAAVA
jgi:carboxypeptidase Taq